MNESLPTFQKIPNILEVHAHRSAAAQGASAWSHDTGIQLGCTSWPVQGSQKLTNIVFVMQFECEAATEEAANMQFVIGQPKWAAPKLSISSGCPARGCPRLLSLILALGRSPPPLGPPECGHFAFPPPCSPQCQPQSCIKFTYVVNSQAVCINARWGQAACKLFKATGGQPGSCLNRLISD